MARILSPDDYGLFAMAAVVHGLLYLVRDLGASGAVQQPGLTPARFHALCRFGMVGGIIIGAVCAASGPLASRFYHEPRLPMLLAVLALCFPCAGAAAPRLALLYREQRIGTAAVIDTTALIVSCIVALGAAAMGAHAWALVALAVAAEATACALAIIFCPWPVKADDQTVGWRGILSFGAHLSATNVANYFSRTCDQIILGRFAGAATLGVYGRGVQATTLPVQFTVAPFTAWIIAELARTVDNAAAYARLFRHVLNGLLYMTLPIAAACIAAPDIIVLVLFGPRWVEAVPVVRWLGVTLALQPWLFAPVWLLVSNGRTRRLAVVAGIALIIVGCAVLSQRNGTVAEMAAAMAASTTLAAVFGLLASLPATSATWIDIVAASWRPFVVGLGLPTVLWFTVNRVGSGIALHVTLCCAMAAVYAVLVLGIWKQVRLEFRSHFLWHR